ATAARTDSSHPDRGGRRPTTAVMGSRVRRGRDEYGYRRDRRPSGCPADHTQGTSSSGDPPGGLDAARLPRGGVLRAPAPGGAGGGRTASGEGAFRASGVL